jgi:hypothetical protein
MFLSSVTGLKSCIRDGDPLDPEQRGLMGHLHSKYESTHGSRCLPDQAGYCRAAAASAAGDSLCREQSGTRMSYANAA